MQQFAIIVSGLPASGKSTVGLQIASALELPYLDKDDFLEQLFASEGVGDEHMRRRLSREADVMFRDAAQGMSNVVLVSHWRPRGSSLETGTSTAWLTASFASIVEVFCRCTPAESRHRFFLRKRHEGHLDQTRNPEQFEVQMIEIESGYPLRIGQLIEFNATEQSDLTVVIEQIKSLLLRP
jgi:gluconate kinase